MLADWLSEDGRKAIEKMGWPLGLELIDSRRSDKHRFVFFYQGASDNITGGTALALLRDRAREWLVELCGVVEIREYGRAVLREGAVYRIQKKCRGAARVSVPRPDGQRRHEYYDTNHDRAMIQAILATEK